VPDHAAVRVEPQTLEVPDALVPEVKPTLVALHLLLDDPQVYLGCLSGLRPEPAEILVHSLENPALELQEIGVDAHPMARVFPVGGLQVLTLEGTRGTRLGGICHCRRF
jgi:hypothetical protein